MRWTCDLSENKNFQILDGKEKKIFRFRACEEALHPRARWLLLLMASQTEDIAENEISDYIFKKGYVCTCLPPFSLSPFFFCQVELLSCCFMSLFFWFVIFFSLCRSATTTKTCPLL